METKPWNWVWQVVFVKKICFVLKFIYSIEVQVEPIECAGLTALGKALALNKSLTHLELSGNPYFLFLY